MTTKPGEISVVASGEASVAPDLAIVSFSVSGEGKQLAPTRDDVNRRASAVLAALRKLGIAEGDLNAPDVGIHPQYDYRKGQRLTGYHVQRQMTARIRDLERLGEVLDGVVAAGANEVHGTQMSAADPSAPEHEALASAVTAARAKAEAIAAAAGVAIEPRPFTPALRALLVTEYDARWLGPPEEPPWTKLSGRELSRHLTKIPPASVRNAARMGANGT